MLFGFPVSEFTELWLILFIIQIVLANPGSEVMKKLDSSKVLELIGHEWIFPTVAEAVAECGFVLHSHKPGMAMGSAPSGHENIV